jgi:hypothetical protein
MVALWRSRRRKRRRDRSCIVDKTCKRYSISHEGEEQEEDEKRTGDEHHGAVRAPFPCHEQ